MLEWKSRLVVLLVAAAALAIAFGNSGVGFFNHGW